MKTKWRFTFVGAALFVIIVSYKILEPELFRTGENRFVVDKEPFGGKVVEEAPAAVEADDHHRNAFYVADENSRRDEVNVKVLPLRDVQPNPNNNNVSISKVIETMIERFTPVYTNQLLESPWKVAAKWVTARQIHPQKAQELGAILYAMSHGKITMADFGVRGTQLKLTLIIDDTQQVVFKPAWYTRDYIVTGKPYSGRDRHNAEIASFHLGRILELRRTPLAIGRRIDIINEIMPVASDRLLSTFYKSNDESCFYGKCIYCKGPEDGVCPTNGIMEGTLVLWLPHHFKMTLHKHPWSRTYRESKLAKWETDDNYCESIKANSEFSNGPRLLDIIDTCVFDYLIGNADRHHYETFDGFDDSMLIILDNGKSFGNPHHDEITILAPLYQCCQIRSSLWQRLLALQDGVLSKVLAGVLSHDPISPILTNEHFKALGRRLKTILREIQNCISKVGISAIVTNIDDDNR